jgi:hypothetical protein
MFVHHDVPLPDFPLCTSWMDFNPRDGDRGKTLLPSEFPSNLCHFV